MLSVRASFTLFPLHLLLPCLALASMVLSGRKYDGYEEHFKCIYNSHQYIQHHFVSEHSIGMVFVDGFQKTRHFFLFYLAGESVAKIAFFRHFRHSAIRHLTIQIP